MKTKNRETEFLKFTEHNCVIAVFGIGTNFTLRT